MHVIDIKTVMLLFALNEVVCSVVMAVFWLQGRKRSPEFIYWLVSNLFQLIGFVLILFRGAIPDMVSIVLATTLLLVGMRLNLVGFERYSRKQSSRLRDFVALPVFIAGSVFFTYAWQNISMRNVSFSLGVAYYFAMITILALLRVSGEWRFIMRPVGITALFAIAVNAVRIAKNVIDPVSLPFFDLGTLDAAVIVANGLLAIALNFAIVLMVSRRLTLDLETDLVENSRVRDELWRSKERFLSAFKTSPNSIVISTLADGKIIEVNDAFVRITGFSREDSVGKTTLEIGIWEDSRERDAIVMAIARGESIMERETRFRRKDGSPMICLFSSQRLMLEQGECILSTIQDVTERKRDEETILHLATHDMLTNLPGPKLARDRLEMAMALAKRLGNGIAALFIDVDGFKGINDTWGHDAGDRALKEIAARLSSCVRASDTVARMGGDEFLVILSNLNARESSRAVAGKIAAAFASPMALAEGTVSVTVSVGIARFPEDGATPDALVKAADGAMYRVKRAGKNDYGFAGDR